MQTSCIMSGSIFSKQLTHGDILPLRLRKVTIQDATPKAAGGIPDPTSRPAFEKPRDKDLTHTRTLAHAHARTHTLQRPLKQPFLFQLQMYVRSDYPSTLQSNNGHPLPRLATVGLCGATAGGKGEGASAGSSPPAIRGARPTRQSLPRDRDALSCKASGTLRWSTRTGGPGRAGVQGPPVLIRVEPVPGASACPACGASLQCQPSLQRRPRRPRWKCLAPKEAGPRARLWGGEDKGPSAAGLCVLSSSASGISRYEF